MIHKSMSVMNRERAVRRTASSGKKKKLKATSYKRQAASNKWNRALDSLVNLG